MGGHVLLSIVMWGEKKAVVKLGVDFLMWKTSLKIYANAALCLQENLKRQLFVSTFTK